MSYWIDKGIDGFYLNGIEYLARIPNGTSPVIFFSFDGFETIFHEGKQVKFVFTAF